MHDRQLGTEQSEVPMSHSFGKEERLAVLRAAASTRWKCHGTKGTHLYAHNTQERTKCPLKDLLLR